MNSRIDQKKVPCVILRRISFPFWNMHPTPFASPLQYGTRRCIRRKRRTTFCCQTTVYSVIRRHCNIHIRRNREKRGCTAVGRSKITKQGRYKLKISMRQWPSCQSNLYFFLWLAPLLISLYPYVVWPRQNFQKKHVAPNGILKIEIDGICIGGAGITVGNKGQHGWPIFVWTDPDLKADQKRYTCYCDNVLLPFIQQSWAEFDGLQEDKAIKDEDQVVTWCDRDLAQIATIISEESLTTSSNNKIRENKHNAARSRVEQPADLTKCFKLIILLQKAMTVVNMPADRHPLKKLMLEIFSKLHGKDQPILSLTKRLALVKFVSILPEMSGKAVTNWNILHWFWANSIIDKDTNRFPDFDKILWTCRLLPSTESYELCVQSFAIFFAHQLKYGHVSEENFEDLRFLLIVIWTE